MKERVRDSSRKNFARYGGRGIDICEEWIQFAPFREWALSHGWAEGLQLDRIDNNVGYRPENCRFVTCESNIRNSTVAKLTIESAQAIRNRLAENISHKAIASEFGISTRTIRDIRDGKTWR
jgi:predicted DNA-binding protein (UPF0251 family)